MTNTKIQPVEWFQLIEREIQKKVLHLFHNLTPWDILFIYGESWVGKSTIMDTIHSTLSHISPHSDFFSWEWKENIDNPKSGILEFLKTFNILDDSDFSILFNRAIRNIHNNNLFNNHHTTDFRFSLENLPPSVIHKLIFDAFYNYSNPYIFFDAVENLLNNNNNEKNNNDKYILLEILHILSQKWVKIILSSRNFESINNWVAPIIAVEIEKFSYCELEDFLKLNIPILSNIQKWTIKKLCKYTDSQNQERYEPISLSLLYTLYTENISHFYHLLEEVSKTGIENINTLFEMWERHVAQWVFQHEVKILLLKKLFWFNQLLLSYLNKTFLLRYHVKKSISAYPIDISDSEWESFEHFVSINGRIIKNHKDDYSQQQLLIHDSLYHLIVPYFQYKIKVNFEGYLQYISWYYYIFKDWFDNRIPMGISLEIIKPTLGLCKTEIQKLLSPLDFVIFLKNFAEILGSLGLFYESIQELQYVLIIYDKYNDTIEDKNLIWIIHIDLWNAFLGIWNFKESIIEYSYALENSKIWESRYSDNQFFQTNLARSYMGIWNSLQALWNNDEAIVQYKNSLSIYLEQEKIDSWSLSLKNDIGRCYSNIWVGLLNSWKYKESIIYLQNSLAIRESLEGNMPEDLNLKMSIATTCMNYWLAFRYLGKYSDAIKHYERCLDLRLKIEKLDWENQIIKSDIARVRLNLGVVFWSLGEYENALNHFKQCLEIRLELEKLDPENQNLKNGIALILMNIWLVYASLLEYKKSIQYYKECLEIRVKAENNTPNNYALKDDIAKLYINLWESYVKIGKPRKALRHFQKSLKICLIIEREHPNNHIFQNDTACVHMFKGNAYYHIKRYGKSIKEYRRSLEIFSKLQNQAPENQSIKKYIASVYSYIGLSLFKYHKYEESLFYYEKSLEEFISIETQAPWNRTNKNDIAQIYNDVWNILFKMKDIHSSLQLYIKAKSLWETLFQHSENEKYKNNISKVTHAIQRMERIISTLSDH